MIKLADKTSNLHSIIHSPPKDWSDERKTEYLEWAHEVVSGCRGVSTFLEDEFDRAYTEGLKAMPVRTDRFMYEAGDLQPANTPEEIQRLEDERKEFDKWMASTLKKQDE